MATENIQIETPHNMSMIIKRCSGQFDARGDEVEPHVQFPVEAV